MSITPCQGHNPVFFTAVPGDIYTSSKIRISKREFSEFYQQLDQTSDQTLYDLMICPKKKFSLFPSAMRIDNEDRSNYSDFFNLQAQINKNGKQLSDTKTTVGQVFVHKDVLDLPSIYENNYSHPCPGCLQQLTTVFKEAIQKSCDVTSKYEVDANWEYVGQNFKVIKKTTENSLKRPQQMNHNNFTPKKKSKNK